MVKSISLYDDKGIVSSIIDIVAVSISVKTKDGEEYIIEGSTDDIAYIEGVNRVKFCTALSNNKSGREIHYASKGVIEEKANED